MPPLRYRVAVFAASLSLISIGVSAKTTEISTSPLDADAARHLLDRIAYGPAPGDLERIESIGTRAYVEEQLAPENLAQPAALTLKLATLDTTRRSAANLYREFGEPARKAAKGDEVARKMVLEAATRVAAQSQDAHLLRAVYSPAQLQEVMTDFWFNHFNVFAGKGADRIWVGTYERDAIRPYALGHFRDLLGATAKHPAMLFFLDNWRSTANGFKPRSFFGLNPKASTGLNENYAREVMELHTLGVDGGYTQTDVTELARILTGWTYDPRAMLEGGDAGFVFAPRRHDSGDKVFLGQTFPAGHGQDEGERALDLLANSPATAKHLAFELTQYFVADAPSPALVDRVAARFAQTHGDVRETLRTILLSSEFAAAGDNQFKTPYEFVVSALRAADVDLNNPRPALQALRLLGEPLFACQTPDGYKTTQDVWLNPEAMVTRTNLAAALGSGRLTKRLAMAPEADTPTLVAAPDSSAVGKQVPVTFIAPAKALDQVPAVPIDLATLEHTTGLKLSSNSAQTIAQAPLALRAGLLLGSPEFMRR